MKKRFYFILMALCFGTIAPVALAINAKNIGMALLFIVIAAINLYATYNYRKWILCVQYKAEGKEVKMKRKLSKPANLDLIMLLVSTICFMFLTATNMWYLAGILMNCVAITIYCNEIRKVSNETTNH